MYQHLIVEDTKMNSHPVMLGPILVHQKLDFSAFKYFSSMLVGLEKQLKNVLTFGTDGDRALVEALAHNFPFATQLCCFLHFKKNIKQKLKDLGSLFELQKSTYRTFSENV